MIEELTLIITGHPIILYAFLLHTPQPLIGVISRA